MRSWDWDNGLWNPWAELARARERMEALLHGIAPGLLRAQFPPVNVWTGEQKAVVTAEVPGVKAEDLEVSIEDGELTIRCMRAPENLKEGEQYVRQERWHGEFSRSVSLPFRIDQDKVSASCKDGILRVELPRAEEAKPSRIPIQA